MEAFGDAQEGWTFLYESWLARATWQPEPEASRGPSRAHSHNGKKSIPVLFCFCRLYSPLLLRGVCLSPQVPLVCVKTNYFRKLVYFSGNVFLVRYYVRM